MAMLIPDMDIPISCSQCHFCDDESRFCSLENEYVPTWKKPEFCRLIEVDIDVKMFSMVVNYCKNHTATEFAEMNRMYEERKNGQA